MTDPRTQRQEARQLLRRALDNRLADFHPGQWEAIDALVNRREKLLVVQRTARRFVLRLGNAAVGVWNDGYDELGRGSPSGTTVSGVVRVLKQGANDE